MVKLDYQRLKTIRLEQDVTQKELAQSTGVSLSTIKQIETGRSSTDLENIQKLCTYLDVDINEIYHPDYHDTKVLCMLNNKGGCGKTSLCSGIATSMAAHPRHRRRRSAQPVQQLRHAPQREELRRGGAGGAGLERLYTAHQI